MASLKVSRSDQQSLALWAATCAERVLPVFESDCADDARPREALEAARAWARGEIECGSSARDGGFGARAAAIAAHDAARTVKNPAAQAAARAAGHAAAVAHMAGHARSAAMYALKAVIDADAERTWQMRNLPAELQSLRDELLA